MNHKKFIQLLNLYIDGEASPVEVREVEHEIEHDPARRRIYNEYCQIQAATRAVYHQFQTAAGSTRHDVGTPDRLRAAGLRSAAAQPGRAPGPPFRRALFWASGAAAACMAVALAFWSMPRAAAPVREVQTAEPAGVSVPTVAEPVAVAASTPTPPERSYTAPLAAAVRSDPYVIQSTDTQTASDPFALASPPRFTALGDPELVLTAVPTYEAKNFAPAAANFDPASVAEQNRKLQSILRRGIAPEGQESAAGLDPEQAQPQKQPSPFVPVNFRQQPQQAQP